MKNIFLILLALLCFSSLLIAADFDHNLHLEVIEGEPCSICHETDATSIRPDLNTCRNCHEDEFVNRAEYPGIGENNKAQKSIKEDRIEFPGLSTHDGPLWAIKHGKDAKAGKIDCAACHEQASCVDCHTGGFADEMGSIVNNPVNVHRSDFIVSHPIMAKANTRSCYSCHEKKSCSDCHEKFLDEDLAGESHRKGWSQLLTSPSGIPHEKFSKFSCQTCHVDSILPAHEWSNNHAREARRNLETCQSCHATGDTCLKCHSARSGLMINPHPKGWNRIKSKLRKASNGRSCRKCH